MANNDISLILGDISEILLYQYFCTVLNKLWKFASQKRCFYWFTQEGKRLHMLQNKIVKQNYTTLTINALLSTSEKKRIRVLSALSGLMSVQQRDKDSQIWPITTDIGWQYLKFRIINTFAPFSSNCKVSPIKRCFYWFSQEGRVFIIWYVMW